MAAVKIERIAPMKEPDAGYEDRSEDEHERDFWRRYLSQPGGRELPAWAGPIAEKVQAELAADGKRAYVESEHPRDPGGEGGGQWIKKGTSAAGAVPTGEAAFNSETEDWSTVLQQKAKVESLFGEQTDKAFAEYGDDVPPDEPEAAACKVQAQNAIAAKLAGDEDFKSLISALDPYGDWKAEFEFGGSMDMATTVEQQVAALAIGNWARTSGDTEPIAMQFQMAAEQEFGLEGNPYIREQWEQHLESLAATYGPDVTVEQIKSGEYSGAREVFSEQQMRGARKFLRAQYEVTQNMFKDAGIKEVYAYRGMRFGHPDSTEAPPPEIQASIGKAIKDWGDDSDAWSKAAREGGGTDETLVGLGRPPRLADYAGTGILAVHQNPLSSWSENYQTARRFASSSGVTHSVIGARIDVRRILSTPFTGFGCLREGELVVMGGKDMDAMGWAWNDDMYDPMDDEDFHNEWAKAGKK